MLPKIYVSGNWDNRNNISAIINKLEEVSDITHDWTSHEDESLFTNRNYLKCINILNEDGIKRADYLVAVIDNPGVSYIETWTDVGIALGSDVGILMYNPVGVNCIYMNHPGLKVFNSLDDIYNFLKDN